MAETDLNESRPPEGSGGAAEKNSKPGNHTRRGSLRKARQRLSRLVPMLNEALFGHGQEKPEPAAKGQSARMATAKPKAMKIAAEPPAQRSTGDGHFRLLTLDEIEQLPDPEWLIAGILPAGGLAVLYGAPGAGKSFLALDWALSTASNLSWLDRSTNNGTVVYVYAEGALGLKYRARAWRVAREKKPGRIRFLPHAVDLHGGGAAELIKAIRKDGAEPCLVVIDTLARCFGSGDENAGKDMNAFVAGAEALREGLPGVTVLVVHHSGKDERKGDRGHTALRAAADTMMRLSNAKGSLTLQCDKQKDAEAFSKFPLHLRVVDLGGGRTSCVVERLGVDSVLEPGDPRSRESDTKALDALSRLGPEGASFSEWLAASGLADSTFKDALKRLKTAKQVEQNGRLYRVTQRGPGAETGPELGWPAAA